MILVKAPDSSPSLVKTNLSLKDSACRCFGFLVSKRKYIFTIDDDCFVSSYFCLAFVFRHYREQGNLLTPSTPFFFNTLYDLLGEGVDFARGYPFSLRGGVPAAISHGLCLNIPDYDPPTQLFKPLERNTRYVDAVLTIPKGTLFPTCGMNLAFDRELIGPAIYLIWTHGLAGVPRNTRSYTGRKISSHSSNLLSCQKSAEPYSNATMVHELSKMVKEKPGPVDPCFQKLGDAMVTWIEAWDEHNSPAQEAAAPVIGVEKSWVLSLVLRDSISFNLRENFISLTVLVGCDFLYPVPLCFASFLSCFGSL
ncbi:hypothetical protein POTOM_050712 [Populus tomentosa]|uniref:Uncharacterized protein n=1 Tax=Populus tomentosa TaxID=118781 RepID=A0A8X7Y8M6_POPTO|nr:hypothetical protein POTOM_050712 [Populus tomentosa]